MSGFIINEDAFEDIELNESKKQSVKKNNKKSKLILDIIIVLLSVIFVFSLCYIGRYYLQTSRNENINNQLVEGVVSYTDSSDDNINIDSSENTSSKKGSGKKRVVKVPESIDFTKLKNQNKDVVGWIFSKNGVINYPILQGNDNSYYLNHLISGKKNINGSIFMDYAANSNFSDYNTFIYGHSMDNGSMFRTLLNYKKQSYYDKYPEFYIYTPDGYYRLLVFAAYETTSKDSSYRNIADKEDFEKYISNAIKKSKIKTNVEVDTSDKVVTLSTCAYSSKDAKFLVFGKLVPVDSFYESTVSEDNSSNVSENVSSESDSSITE